MDPKPNWDLKYSTGLKRSLMDLRLSKRSGLEPELELLQEEDDYLDDDFYPHEEKRQSMLRLSKRSLLRLSKRDLLRLSKRDLMRLSKKNILRLSKREEEVS